MSTSQWQIPSSVMHHLEQTPEDRVLLMLLRHSVRDHLPPDEVAYDLPITEHGNRLAVELGGHLRGRLRTLHTSPLARCVQTAEALAKGSGTDIAVVPDRLFGAPGVFVLDDRLAWSNWQRLGHEGVMRHLVTEQEALPGMAHPEEAARFLVQYMLDIAGNRPGVHVFVTHDSLVTATAARLIHKPLGPGDWPNYLEAAFFWMEQNKIHASYRSNVAMHPNPVCNSTSYDFLRGHE